MGMSPYMATLRSLVGHTMLQIPYVGAWIVNQDGQQILLAQHARDGLWGLIGGAAEPEERLEDALRREVFEETGLAITIHGLHSVHSGPETTVTYGSGDQISAVALIYRCTLVGKCKPTLDTSEVQAVTWHDLNTLDILPLKPWLLSVAAAN